MMLAATPAATERAGALALPGGEESDTPDLEPTRRVGDCRAQAGDARLDGSRPPPHGCACGNHRRMEPAGVFVTPRRALSDGAPA
jgi:hypothetical protein